MKSVTIEKIISRDRISHRAVKRVSTFKPGEIVKFNTEAGVKIAIVTADDYLRCSKCVFFDLQSCPTIFTPNPLKNALLCNHHKDVDMNLYFKPLDSVLENI